MSPTDRDKPSTELESMYREHGDVEPNPGLDRVIRARADAAAQRSRSRRPAPWIGGLVTASVAVVAIAVVLRQAPTAPDTAPEPAPQAAPSNADARAPRAGAALESGAPSARRSPSTQESGRLRALDESAAETPPAEARQRDAFIAEPGAIADDAIPAPERRAAGEAERETASVATAPELATDPESMIESIRALIEGGELERARRRAETLQRLHPEATLPDDLRAVLAEPPGDADG